MEKGKRKKKKKELKSYLSAFESPTYDRCPNYQVYNRATAWFSRVGVPVFIGTYLDRSGCWSIFLDVAAYFEDKDYLKFNAKLC
jgi:hypothetical protein